ncbi:hypothetical protein OCO_24640 [Mycobacterium intracellulare MOTT-02]|nr:hypothetical protein OCO_24640 [Mycobacterium intracellulare MOTT-02]
MAVPHSRPRCRRLRRPEAQVSHRWTGIRDRPPPINPVPGEALDGAGGRVCADSPVMHKPDGNRHDGVNARAAPYCPARRLA